MKPRLIGILVVASWAFLVPGAQAVPQSFQLVFDGRHVPATFPTPTGLMHVGPFTTNSQLCPSGHAKDIAQDDQLATRQFTCDGSGAQFTALITPHLNEHGGTGTWQIVDGTGPLADLRGKGTWESVLLGGTSSNPASITFRSTWKGVVAFDATPPTISLGSVNVRRLKKPRHSYVVRLRVTLDDDNGNAVSYAIALSDSVRPFATLAFRTGETSTGAVATAFSVRPTARTRVLRLKIDATDPLGNVSTFTANVRLR